MKRDRWSSRTVFLFASIGSAVGLGNVWRFPYLAGKYGGGAFLIPYLLMLIIIGIPLLILEFAIGQRMQLGAVGSFKKIRTKLSGVGFAAVFCGFIVCSYYCVIMAWSALYLIFSPTLSWGANTEDFFLNNVLHSSAGAGETGFVVLPILLALVLVWVLIYFSIWKGIKSVSKVVTITMPLPIILIIVLVIRGVTLQNGINGVLFYITPSFELLFSKDWIEIWAAAASQIFFTLSIAFGVMIAYASYKHEESDISKNAVITAVANSAISIVAGFAVFSTLGYMAYKSGVNIEELAKGGVSLAFIVFPQALSMLPFPKVFAVMFFVMLLTLGIDSAFSLVEAVSTVVRDKWPHIRKQDISVYVCVTGFVFGIIFTTFAGRFYLDITDHFITTYGLVLVGLLEVIVVGWLYGPEKLRGYINEVSDIKIGKWWNYFIAVLIPAILIALLVWSFKNDIEKPYEGYENWALWLCGWGMLIFVFAVSLILSLLSKRDENEPAPEPENS